MILDHEWLAALAELTDHSPGIVSSALSIAIYALLRDGVPRFKRWRYERANGRSPGHNPGNEALTARVSTCEGELKEVNDFISRADERWKAQADHNKRMEDHVKVFYKKFDQLAGLGK